MDIRDEAIALLVEKLREIGAEADQQHKTHTAATGTVGYQTVQDFADHRHAAALNWQLATRCEDLIEQIQARSLFDEIDAEQAELAAAAAVKEGAR